MTPSTKETEAMSETAMQRARAKLVRVEKGEDYSLIELLHDFEYVIDMHVALGRRNARLMEALRRIADGERDACAIARAALEHADTEDEALSGQRRPSRAASPAPQASA